MPALPSRQPSRHNSGGPNLPPIVEETASQKCAGNSNEHGNTPLNTHTFNSSGPTASLHSRFNQLEDSIENISSSGVYTTAQDFDQKNSDSIRASARGVGSNVDVLAIEEKVRGFAESSRILMKVLDEVQKLHPFIGIAVLAFKAVVTLELKRRINDQKIIALQVKMQDMMSVLVQLRGIRPEQTTSDGTSIKDRLQAVMNSIAGDIKACGNVCDTYSKKRLIVRLLKAPIYEGRLANFVTVFSTHRKDIKFGLLMFTATGVDAANRTLADVHETLRDTQEMVNLMVVFRRLDTPHEKELLGYITSNGGPEKCMQDDTLLKELSNIRDGFRVSQGFASGPARTVYGQSNFRRPSYSEYYPSHSYRPSQMYQPAPTQVLPQEEDRYMNQPPAERTRTRPSEAIPQAGPARDYAAEEGAALVVSIRKELNEDIDQSLKANLAIFGRKLFVQQQQLVKELEDIVERQGDRIINETKSGPHDRIIDPELRAIWKEMGWKLSVEARLFVLTLRDYFEEKYDELDPVDVYLSLAPSSGFAEERALATVLTTAKQKVTDMWAFAYINIANVQPILEAFDDDSTGYVSIREANQLSRSKPKEWSLPQWLAYWAAGWHFVVWEYRSKICNLIDKMHDALELILPTNRFIVDEYLSSPDLYKLDALMSSLVSCPYILDHNLAEKVSSYTQKEEARIENNLWSIKYNIDAPNTLALVTGPGRIERYIFPLIFLLLKHHFRIIKIACREVLHRHEFSTPTESIHLIMDSVDARINTLDVTFRQQKLGVTSQLRDFAFGMFHVLYAGGPLISSSSIETLYEDPLGMEEIDTSILRLGVGDGVDVAAYDTRELDLDDLVRLNTHSKNLIDGLWTGHRFGTDDTICYGLIEVVIDTPTPDGHFHGRANDADGDMTIEGKIQSGDIYFEAIFTHGRRDDPAPLFIVASLDPTAGTIKGKWGLQSDRAPILGTLQLYRTPVSTHGFRYSKEQHEGNQARARWSLACSAIRYHVRQRLGIISWSFLESRFRQRRHFAELQRCLDMLGDLTETQKAEMLSFKLTLSPADARFYISISRSHFDWSCLHLKTICSWCQNPIIGARIICLGCISWTTSDQLDLCGGCVNATPETGRFSHHWSHPLLKIREFLHDRHKSTLVTKAEELANRLEGEFPEPTEIHSPRPRFAVGPPDVITNDIDEVPNDLNENGDVSRGIGASGVVTSDTEFGAGQDWAGFSPATAGSESSDARSILNEADTPSVTGDVVTADSLAQAPVSFNMTEAGIMSPRSANQRRCSYCTQEILDTFWICLSCEKDTFVCEDCDKTDRKWLDKTWTHNSSHPLLRLTFASKRGRSRSPEFRFDNTIIRPSSPWYQPTIIRSRSSSPPRRRRRSRSPQVVMIPPARPMTMVASPRQPTVMSPRQPTVMSPRQPSVIMWSPPASPPPMMTAQDLLEHQAVIDQRFAVLNAQLADNLVVVQETRRAIVQEIRRAIARRIAAALLLAFAAVVGWLIF